MKRIVAHIMLLSLVAHLFYSSGYLLDYYVNMDSYKKHCMNRDRPELHCDGKCILAQKIAAAQKEHAPDQSKMTIPASLEYISNFFVMELSCSFHFSQTNFGWLSSYTYQTIGALLRPPQLFI